MTEKIYVALLDEGVAVRRPVPAWRIEKSMYILLRPDDYDPQLETWEFPPGSVVVVESRQVDEGAIYVAVRSARQALQTA